MTLKKKKLAVKNVPQDEAGETPSAPVRTNAPSDPMEPFRR